MKHLHIRKKLFGLCIIMAVLLLCSGFVVVSADTWHPVSFYFHNIYTGVNSEPVYKTIGTNITYVSQTYNSLGPSVPTNVIVIGSDSSQITYNGVVTQTNYVAWLPFYSRQHEGLVMLRANTGSSIFDYGITGFWSPNEIYYDESF